MGRRLDFLQKLLCWGWGGHQIGEFVENQGKRKIFRKIRENQGSFRLTIVSF